MIEPRKHNQIENLQVYLWERVRRIIKALEDRGLDPVIVESYRSKERQRWLYGQGRSKWQCIRAGISPAYSHPGQIVTKTLDSYHIKRKAVDVISRSKGYTSKAFFDALWTEAAKENMHHLGNWDRAHIQFEG